ncbi:hypothetical protein BDR07DRAFT_1407339 [Suillus spraguei]|nr:hypothetical protein BDR07DRAFT_1407339 [Suillus spraguei]
MPNRTQQEKVHKACAELWEDQQYTKASGEQWRTMMFFMAVSLVDENAALGPAESLLELSVPRSVVDSITCNIQRAHPHPLLPIMFLRYQCLIASRLSILALHILYFLLDTHMGHITHSLPSIIYIMHPIIHSIISFCAQLSYTCASSFKCTSFFTLVTLLIL